MPRHEDFEKIYRNFIDQYGEEEGEEKYFVRIVSLEIDQKPLTLYRPF